MSEILYKVVEKLNEHDILLFRIRNKYGAYVEISNYGATLVSLVVPDKYGMMQNIILSYNNITDYFTDTFYLGSTIGRFANRIANAQFTLNKKTYLLDKNDGNHSNHGGFKGFNSKIFDYEVYENKLMLKYKSKDGEGGFPGNMDFSVNYSLSDDHKLHIEFRAVSDKESIFNPTNHAYFNLSEKDQNIGNHELKVFAENYLETDNEFIPTGNILKIAGSAFDFRDYRTINQMMPLKKEIIQGYNTYFISDSDEDIKLLASIKHKKSERTVDVYSTMPGVQIYTGDYLSGKQKPFSGICLEAQFYPDGPNHHNFETCVLIPGKEVSHSIIIAAY